MDFMKSCGLEAWHSHITKHTSIKTPQQLRMITAFELGEMAVVANMRLDPKTIDQVLAAVKRRKLPTSRTSRLVRQVSIPQFKAKAATSSSQGSASRASARSSLISGGTSGADDVKAFLKQRGLEAWHGHLTKHLNIKTSAQVKAITAIDLRRMATAANMRLDQMTIDQLHGPS